MHSIPYRTKQRIRKGLKIAAIVLAVLVLLDLLAIIYLGRYLVYDENGAHIDLNRSTGKQVNSAEFLQPEQRELPQVDLIYGDPSTEDGSSELVSGYYIDLQMLQDPDAVLEALTVLDGPCTVMIDLKSGSGAFYYSTGIAGAQLADTIDVTKVDRIISYLRSNQFTMIARVPGFRDTAFALENIPCGLAMPNAALWMDSDGYFWLNPEDGLVLDYMKQIVSELASKGFREIVFDDFYFPESSQIAYTSDKTRPELIYNVATQLINYFKNANITISFGDPSTDFALDNEGSRVYLTDVDGSGVGGAVAGYSRLVNPEKQLVFLTASRDTRFEGYHLLRPLL